MWKKIISFTFVMMVFALSGKTAEAAPLAPVPLFQMGDIVITEYGVHYVEGLGEIELKPADDIEISPLVSVQGSRRIDFPTNASTWNTVTTLTRNQPNRMLQLTSNHAQGRQVEFRIASGAFITSQFTIASRITFSLDGVIGIGQQGRIDVRPVHVGGSHSTIGWWMHP